MTAPRIDTVRKQAHGTLHRLAAALEHLEDLHGLGWYRHSTVGAREQLRTKGADPLATGIDLDTHGSPEARAAYERMAGVLLAVSSQLDDAIAGALKLFDAGQVRARRDTSADCSAPEVVSAIAQRDKRLSRGEGTVMTVAQPMPRGGARVVDAAALSDELEALRSAVRKTGLRADRARFTPRELTAWQAASGVTSKRRKGR